MMGVWYLIPLLCPRVFYYDYKAKRQQRKWDKENLWIPNSSKAVMMVWCSSWTLTNRSQTPWSYSGDSSSHNGRALSVSTDRRQRRQSWAVLFSCAFSSSNLLTTPLLSFPVLPPTSMVHFSFFYPLVSSYCHYKATSRRCDLLDPTIISYQWWWPKSDHNCSLNSLSNGCGMTSLDSHSPP